MYFGVRFGKLILETYRFLMFWMFTILGASLKMLNRKEINYVNVVWRQQTLNDCEFQSRKSKKQLWPRFKFINRNVFAKFIVLVDTFLLDNGIAENSVLETFIQFSYFVLNAVSNINLTTNLLFSSFLVCELLILPNPCQSLITFDLVTSC